MAIVKIPKGKLSATPTGATGGGGTTTSANDRLKALAPIKKSTWTKAKVAVGNTVAAKSAASGGLKGTSSSGGGGGGSWSSGGGSYGGGSSVPSAPIVSPGVIDPATGYLPIAGDLFTVAPEGMLADLVQQWYPGEQGNAIYEMLKPYAEVANILFLAEKGTSVNEGTKNDYVNWLKNYFTTLRSTGFTVSAADLLNNVLNPAEGSPLQQYQSLGNPIEQQQNTQQLLGAIYNTYFHPLIANAARRQLDLEGARYIGQSGREVLDPFYQQIQTLPSAPMLRMGR